MSTPRREPSQFRWMAFTGAALFLLHTLPARAQSWTTVSSNPPLNQVFMFNSFTGWAVSSQGGIRAMTSGTWGVPVYPTTQSLAGVWAASVNNAWAVGANGTILKWNGGTWATQNSGTGNNLCAVSGLDAVNVWAVGLGGTLLRWNGAAWTAQNTGGVTDDLRGVWAADTSNVWAVGANGRILHWDGSAWASVASGTSNNLLAVWGSNASNVWAVGSSGTILKWDGTSWTPQTSNTSSTLFGVAGADASNVWAVGSSGTLMKFDGSAWAAQTSGVSSDLLGISVVNVTQAIAVGTVGGFLQWNGSTWSQGAGVIANLNDVWGPDASNVWAVASAPSIYHWNGSAWVGQSSGTSNNLRALHGNSANSIWAVGDNGSIVKWDGTSWTAQTSNTTGTLFGVWAADANNVWVVGKSGVILYWNGSVWAAQSSTTTNALHGIWGIDTNNVWAVGDAGTVLKWNGSAWAAQASSTHSDLLGVSGSSTTNIWAVGAAGTSVFWNGNFWAATAPGTLQDLASVWVAGTTNIWAVGKQGVILKNNGAGWVTQTSGTALPLNSVWGSSSTNLYAVGDSGTTARAGSTPLLPVIIPFGLTNNSSSSGTPSASVDPRGSVTSVILEYGLTAAYGSTTPIWEGSLITRTTVHAQVSGLTPSTVYHYRFTATSSAGSTSSTDQMFTTQSPLPGAPTVTTLPATLVYALGATFNGIVNASGGSTGVFFDFGTTTQYINGSIPASPPSVNGNADTTVTANRTALTPNTTYHYRVRASTPTGAPIYGADASFTVPATGFPAVTTAPPTNLTTTSATLKGFVSANNGPTTTATFEYGLDASYGSTVPVSGSFGGFSFQSVSAAIPVSGANVTYHYRLNATNSNGVVHGADMTFVTPDPHDATLSTLTLNGGTLSPAFERGIHAYNVTVPYEITGLTVTPTAQSIATVAMDGNATVLNVGVKIVTITVTSGDGLSTQAYTITITRSPPVPGSLDFSFGGTGKVTTATGGFGYRTALQNDGRILVAGYSNLSGQDEFALARYNPDGTLDSSFGGTGIVTTAMGTVSDIAFNLAVQNDGRIVAVGQSSDGTYTKFAVVRYNTDGSLDTSFNGTGKVVTSVGVADDEANAVVVQSDGKIVVVGSGSDGAQEYFAVVRYNSNGTLDSSFNPVDQSGIVTTRVGTLNDSANAVALQGDGKIVVVGSSLGSGVENDLALVRYQTNGSLDTDFNLTGVVINKVSVAGAVGYGVRVQSDGNIVVAGSVRNSNWDIALLRYDSTGVLDPNFGSGGVVSTALGLSDDFGNGLTLQADGKIIVAGKSESTDVFSLLRYNADGTLDSSFGTLGKVTTSIGGVDEGAYGVALQGDGKIVVAGYSGNFSTYKFAVARYLGDGPAISVQESSGPMLFDGISTADLGGALPGGVVTQDFIIKNTGLTGLTGLGITIDDPAFTVTSTPNAPLSFADTTTFTVRFAPTAVGTKTTTLHIASNVTGSNGSFDINLTGAGFTQLDNWRQTHFPGSTRSTGPGADNATPLNDGVSNLVKFATGMDPTQPGAPPGSSSISGGNFTFTYTRSKAAVSDGITFTVEWSDTLAPGSWSSAGVAESAADQGAIDLVTATVPTGSSAHRFAHLVISRP